MRPIIPTHSRLLTLVLFIFSVSLTEAQIIDSSSVNIHQNEPDEVYIKFRALSGSRRIIRIEPSYQNNEVTINYIFKDCAASANVWHFDTVFNLDQLNPGSNYDITIASYLDTNTIDMNCFMRATYEYVDSVYYPASAIFIGEPEQISTRNIFTVYPNPVRSHFELEGVVTNSDEIKEVSLYNTSGTLVRSWSSPGEKVYRTSGIGPGVYIIHIKLQDESTQLSKLVICE